MSHKTIIAIIAFFTSLPLFIGCNNVTRYGTKFNKSQWDSVGDLHSYPYRESMVEDLIAHHKIKGLTYHQLIDSLGQPDNYGDIHDSIRYDIVTNYGYLDPKSGKYLAIGLNKDSVATGLKVVDWKNRHANE